MNNGMFDLTVAGRLQEGPSGIFVFFSLNGEILSRLLPALYKPTIEKKESPISVEMGDGAWTIRVMEMDTLEDLLEKLPPASQSVH